MEKSLGFGDILDQSACGASRRRFNAAEALNRRPREPFSFGAGCQRGVCIEDDAGRNRAVICQCIYRCMISCDACRYCMAELSVAPLIIKSAPRYPDNGVYTLELRQAAKKCRGLARGRAGTP